MGRILLHLYLYMMIHLQLYLTNIHQGINGNQSLLPLPTSISLQPLSTIS